MIRTWRWLAVSSLACILLGCPPKKAADDAGADGAAAASAVPEAAPPVAANDADVTKYPDQSNDYMAPLTTRMAVHARSEASNTGGKIVGQLKPGEIVDEVADRGGFDLVVFPDPNDATRKLEGWAPHTAFTALPHIVVDGGIVLTDGGTVVVPDAATPTAEAGPAPIAKPLDEKKNKDGTCNAGYGICGAMCRLKCAADADCVLATAKCSAGFCLGPGASPCAH
jgi:hypothetical protein